MKYKCIRPDWHRIDTEHGTFFGYSRAEVEGKARRAEQHAAIAAQEQAAFLAMSDSQRGARA